MIHENLLPAHRVARRKLYKCVHVWLMSLGTLGLLTGSTVIGAHITKAKPPAMPSSLVQEIEGDRLQLERLQQQLARFEQAGLALEQASRAPRWDRLLALIARESAGRARLKSIQVAPVPDGTSSWSVLIHGSTTDPQSPNAMVAQLESTGLFTSVRRRSVPVVPVDGQTEFYLDCAVTP